MKKAFYLTLLAFIIFISNMYAQSYKGILTLTSQAEVDTFSYVYVGMLIIEGDDIVNLEGLSSLEETEDIIIRNNPLLKNLQGLQNINYTMFYLEISNNSSLESLDGLPRLKIGGDGIVIRDNPVLTDISALEGLSIADETPNLSIYNNPSLSICCSVVDFMDVISSDIHIYNNAPGCNSKTEIRVECEGLNICDGDIFELHSQADVDNFNCSHLNGTLKIRGNDITNLDSLYKLQTVGGDLEIKYNENLESLHGLENLSSVGGQLSLYSNDKLKDLEGINSLTSVGSLTIWGNEMLLNLKGLDKLQTINGGIYISNNRRLQSLEGLTSLGPEHYGSLEIYSNELLTDLSDLENLEKIHGDLTISYNTSLSDCCGISNLVASTTESVSVFNNAYGCNNEQQILCAGCNKPLPEPLFSSNQACAGKEVTFAEGSRNVDETATYHWDFGDGTTGTDKGIFKHIYAEPGEYPVMLTITQDGCSASWGYMITVNPLPEVTLSPFDDVNETDASFTLSGGLPAGGNYRGPGVTQGIFDPSIVGPGKYKIIYTYVNLATGCKDTANQYITVVPATQEDAVVSFTLVNAATDTDIMELTDGMRLYLHALPNAPLNIRANTHPALVGSVFLSLSGPVNASRKEGVAPYALLGDTEGDYAGENFGLGRYTLSATPYSGSNLHGEKGTSLKVDFEIIEEVLNCERFGASLTNIQDVSTCGGSDGAATVEVSGNAGAVAYGWSNGATIATASNLEAGEYTVTVTDEQSCSSTLSVTIESPSLPEATLSPFDPVNTTDAAFVLGGGSPAGGTYSGEGVSNGMFDPSAVGTGSYEITYTYTDPTTQCEASASQMITVAPDFQGDAVISFTLINADTDTDIMELTEGMQINIHDLPNAPLNIRANTHPAVVGSVFLSLSGPVNASRKEGVAPYALFGDVNGNYQGEHFVVGNYTISATPYSGTNLNGEKGLELSINFSIEEEILDCTGFTASLTNVQNVSTCGGSDGAATVEVSGNVDVVTYDWSHEATTATVSNLAAGDYTVTVTDAQDCSVTLSVTIENPVSPEVTLAPFSPVMEDDPAFALSGGSPAGGTYSGPGVSNGMFDPSAVGSGSYEITYTYTDPKTNCTNTASQMITVGNEAITFVLVNTATQQDLFSLHDQSVIDLSAVGTAISIRVDVSVNGTVKRTRFELTGDGYEHILVEGEEPYSLFGDIGESITPWPTDDLKEGQYILKVKPTVIINGVKEMLTHTIGFTIVDNQAANFRAFNAQRDEAEKVMKEEMKETSQQKITVYPNPFAKVIQVEMTGLPDERMEIHLIDLYGRTVFLKNVMVSSGQLKLDIASEHLPEGTYLLQLKGGKNVKMLKLIKQN